MKMTEHANNLESNVKGHRQNFGIEDAEQIISILRNHMYKYKVRTMVQEYICNARDAMREVGKDNNFEITIPSLLNPVFKVRDFGPGISEDRMSNVFIKYGASTKRDNDTQTGGFGIGAKSAWAYTDSFSIVTIVNHVKRSYVAHIGVNNQGSLDLVDTVKTDEANGTEIQVAVNRSDINEFRDAVLRAIYFWKDRPTLKGTTDLATLVKGLSIGNVLEIVKSNNTPYYVCNDYSTPYAIVDGIPYPIDSSLRQKCKILDKLINFSKDRVLFHIGTGVVEIPATRESISDSHKTIDALEKLATKTFMEVKTYISDTFGKVKSTKEYFEVYRKLNEAFYIEKGFATYKDYRINDNFIVSDLLKKIKVTKVHCLGKGGYRRVEKITKVELDNHDKKFPLDNLGSVFYVETAESFLAQNKRIREYFGGSSSTKKSTLWLLEATEYKAVVAPVSTGTFPAIINTANDFTKAESLKALKTVIKDLGVQDIQTVTYVVLPKEQRIKVSREQTQFCVHTLGGRNNRHHYTTLSTNLDKWLYIPIGKDGWENGKHGTHESLKELYWFLKENYGLLLCGLAERAMKMVKGDANFQLFADWKENYKPTQKEINFGKRDKQMNKEEIETLTLIKGIKDEKLNDIVKEYKSFEKLEVTGMPAVLKAVVQNLKEVKDFEKQDEEIVKLLKQKYALIPTWTISHYNKQSVQELAYYLNAKYKERK